MADVRVIKASRDRIVRQGQPVDVLRVAAYCRVSTDTEDQMNSYHSQVKYYTDKINDNPKWQMVDIYTDAAITGTKVDKREGFRKMISDCAANKIDLVITKSISRFARNTVDTLNYVRQLKEKNVAVFFEDENINTMTMDGELLLTVLSSVAQQEVENISANVKKGLKMKMQRGEMVGFNGCLGYDYDPATKSLIVNPRESMIVKQIFDRYVEGLGGSVIARELREIGAIKKDGTTNWTQDHILGIIENVKYKGDLVMGASYVVDPISKRRVKNRGEQDMYYVENHHEAIISREQFDKAQQIRKERAERHKVELAPGIFEGRRYPFSGVVKCGFCGRSYTRRSIHGNTIKYRKFVWTCSNFSKYGKKSCPYCKSIREEILEGAFVESWNKLCQEEAFGEYIKEAFAATMELVETNDYAEHLAGLKDKLDKQTAKRQKLVDLLISEAISNEEFDSKVSVIDGRIAVLSGKLCHFEEVGRRNAERSKSLDKLSAKLGKGCELDKFDPDVFEAAVENIVVGGFDEDGNADPYNLIFVLRCGEKHLLTGRAYKPQRRNAVARLYPEEFRERDLYEIINFKYFCQHFEFRKGNYGMEKRLRDGVNVRISVPAVRKEDNTSVIILSEAA